MLGLAMLSWLQCSAMYFGWLAGCLVGERCARHRCERMKFYSDIVCVCFWIVFFSISHLKCLFLLYRLPWIFFSFSTFTPERRSQSWLLLCFHFLYCFALGVCVFFARSTAALDFNVSIKSDASAMSPSSSVVRCNNRSIHANFVYAAR